jgi:hypothetical protein
VFANPLSATEMGVDAEMLLVVVSTVGVGDNDESSFLQELRIASVAMMAMERWMGLVFVFFMVWILDL